MVFGSHSHAETQLRVSTTEFTLFALYLIAEIIFESHRLAPALEGRRDWTQVPTVSGERHTTARVGGTGGLAGNPFIVKLTGSKTHWLADLLAELEAQHWTESEW